MRITLLALFLCVAFAAQEPPQNQDPEVNRIGGDVTPPSLLSKVEPQYSELARQARIAGPVRLSIVISKEGIPIPKFVTVITPLGFGLDEKAIEAVTQWRFKPGLKSGEPVAIMAQVEVSFRIVYPGWMLQKVSFATPPGVQAPEFQSAEYPRVKHSTDLSLVVQGEINEQGSPANLAVDNPTGMKYEKELTEALGKWHFSPATQDGKPIAVPVTFKFGQYKVDQPAR